MIIQPMIRSNICMNAHPVGCTRNVEEQIEHVRSLPSITMPKRVLVIGSSGGYGLSSRIAAAFGAGATTIGVAFENPAKGKRTATAGWYQDRAFQRLADREGLAHKTLLADAFSHETKSRVVEAIKEMMGEVDLVVYSLASGVRVDPDSGEMYRSAFKTDWVTL